jgi:hypothetical protein
MAKKRRRKGRRSKGRRRGGGGGGGGPTLFGLNLTKLGAAAGVGFIFNPDAPAESISKQVQAQAAKLPKIGNPVFVSGVAVLLANRFFVHNRWLGLLAAAATEAGAYEFGKKGFKLSGAEVGWQDAIDADEVEGMIGEGDLDIRGDEGE